MIGERFGRYRIVAPLGSGGMATVWKAEDELQGRAVAVKVMADHLATSPIARRRFLREAENARSLDHPGLAAVFEAGETGDRPWIAMEWIDGTTLAASVQRAPLEQAEALRVVADAADALQHAHERGVLHRDVTSRNLMVATGGRVVVLDFGIAAARGAESLTASGTIMGTLAWLPPEVVRGGRADERSDVYGLGLVLYEALTGVLPFRTGPGDSVLYAILHAPVEPPSRLRRGLSREVEAAILRAISRASDERPASAALLARELRELMRLPPPSEPDGSGAEAADAPLPVAHLASRPLEHVFLAVLPFEDAGSAPGPDEAVQLRARGLSDALAASLARVPALTVVASDPAIADANQPLAVFARRAGANRVLRGGIRQSGARVRITWSVVDPLTAAQVAGGIEDGAESDLFELEDRLTAAVVRTLELELPAFLVRKPARDPAAAERFLQALGYLRRYEDGASVDGAVAILERLRETEVERAELLAALGRAYLCKYRLTRARAWEARAAQVCERACAIDPGSAEVRLMLAELRLEAGQHEHALEDYRASAAARASAEAFIGIGRSEDALGHPERAEAAFRRAIEIRPDWWGTHNWLGLFLAGRGRFEEAIGAWRGVLALTPDNARAYSNLGMTLFRLGRIEESAEAHERSLAIQPNARAFSNFGSALFHLGRFDDSSHAFERAVALEPGDALAWGHLGSACRLIPGREGRAREALERAVAIMRGRLDRSPNDGYNWARLAAWLINLGRPAESAEAIERALSLAPEDVEVLATAVGVYQQTEPERALFSLQRAIERGYGPERFIRDPALAPLRAAPRFWAIVGAQPP